MICPSKSYPAYKPSGVLWLGDVPEHWEVQRGKALLAPVDIRSTTGDEELLTVSAHRGIVPRETANVTMFKAESYVGYKLCWPGDLVINSLWAWAHGLGVSQHHGIVSSAYGVYRPLPQANARFIHLLARSIPFQWELQVRSKGIWVSRLQLTDEAFLGAPFPLPPLPEQAAIVRYLDHVDRRIRRYLSAKRKLIALLAEARQVVINQAVTRGLDPNVRLRPSGVEWLGDVPEHWERRRLKTILQRIDRISTTGSETLLSLRRDHGVVVYAEHFARPSQSKSLVGFKLVRSGQLVVNRLQANNGLVFNSTLDGLVSPDYSVFEKNSPIQMQFLSDLLRTSFYRAYFRQNSTGLGTGTAGFLRLYDDTFLETPVYSPSLSEQVAIIEYLEKATTDIDSASARARRQIELLQEYRTRLISDVVTGKLDVREAAAQLPDEDDDQEPIEGSAPLVDGMDEDLYDDDNFKEELATEEEVTA